MVSVGCDGSSAESTLRRAVPQLEVTVLGPKPRTCFRHNPAQEIQVELSKTPRSYVRQPSPSGEVGKIVITPDAGSPGWTRLVESMSSDWRALCDFLKHAQATWHRECQNHEIRPILAPVNQDRDANTSQRSAAYAAKPHTGAARQLVEFPPTETTTCEHPGHAHAASTKRNPHPGFHNENVEPQHHTPNRTEKRIEPAYSARPP